MDYYPLFRRAMIHLGVDSYALLTRLPLTLGNQTLPVWQRFTQIIFIREIVMVSDLDHTDT